MNDNLKRTFLRTNLSINQQMFVYHHFFRPALHLVQFLEPTEDWSFCIHSHTKFELIIPTKNSYRCSLNQQNLNVPAGHFLLIQPGQLHQDFYKKDSPFRCIQFFLEQDIKQEILPSIFVPDLHPEKQIAVLSPFAGKSCDLLFDAVTSKLSDNICNALFNGLFWMLMESFPQEYFRKTDDRNSENILQYRINRFFQEAVDTGIFRAEELQKEMRISRKTMDLLFHRLFGMPPVKAFQFYRCQYVRKFLLEHPEASLKDTAELFHFNDQFSMSRSFRKIYGYPPSEVMLHAKT